MHPKLKITRERIQEIDYVDIVQINIQPMHITATIKFTNPGLPSNVDHTKTVTLHRTDISSDAIDDTEYVNDVARLVYKIRRLQPEYLYTFGIYQFA